MVDMEDSQQQLEDSGSLETVDSAEQQTGVISAPSVTSAPPPSPDTNQPLATPDAAPTSKPSQDRPSSTGIIKKLFHKFNAYTSLLSLMVLVIIGSTLFAIQNNRKSAQDAALDTKALTADDLKKLGSSDAVVGDPKQTLSIESNAVFAGKVLVKNGLDVAGKVSIGGSLSLNGINVDGGSSLDQLQTKSLAVSGDGSIQGRLTVQGSLSVSGGASFGGTVSAPQVTVDILTLNKDLTINRHINSGGTTPTKSNGTALGSGGTSTVTGNDTAGTVTINTGSSAPSGCFITITFAAAYTSAPHVMITPVGSGGASISYYVNRSTTNFSVCSANDPPDSTAGIIFDYIVIN